MAKYEEADPRWIVDDMGMAGTNVGRWHWQEKNVTGWCKSRMEQLFNGQEFVTTDKWVCEFTTVQHLKGEANIMNRKARLIALYELDLSVGWKAVHQVAAEAGDADGDADDNAKKPKVIRGTVTVPYISEENDWDELEVSVSVTGGDALAREAKQLVAAGEGMKFIRQQLKTFLEELKGGADVETKYKAWDEQKKTTTTSEIATGKPAPADQSAVKAIFKQTESTTSVQSSKTASSVRVSSLELVEKFRSSAQELFECFIDEKRVSAYTRSKAVIPREVGAKFELFAGAINGVNVTIEPGKRLVQKWRFNDWQPQDHFSQLTMEFVQEEGETTLRLKQTGVPYNEKKRVMQGWRERFMIPIRNVFGFGAVRTF